MFDGNHRTRRAVDLSGRSGRRRTRTSTSSSGRSGTTTTTTSLGGREALVETARLEREKRQLQAKREKSAKTIQRYVRGYQRRTYIALDLLSGVQNKPKSLVLSIQLSKPIVPFYKKTNKKKQNKTITNHDDATTTTVVQALADYYKHSSTTEATTDQNIMTKVSHQRILQATLQELRPLHTSKEQIMEDFNSQLFALAKTLLTNETSSSSLSLSINLLMDLVKCCQEWISYNATLEISKQLWQYACQCAFGLMSPSSIPTTQWSSSSPSSLPSQHNFGLALLAGTIFGAKSKLFLQEDTSLWYMNILQQHYYDYTAASHQRHHDSPTMNSNEWYQTYLIPCLVQVLKGTLLVSTKISGGAHDDFQKQQKQQQNNIHQTVSNMVNGRESILLSNALDIWDSCHSSKSSSSTAATAVSMIELIQVVLERRSKDVGVLTSLVIRGQDNIQALVGNDEKDNGNTISSSVAALHVDEVESDEDEDLEDHEDAMEVESTSPFPAAATSAAITTPTSTSRSKRHKKAASKSKKQRYRNKKLSNKQSYYNSKRKSTYTRQEILTVPKLDRLYQEQVFRLRKTTLEKLQKSITKKPTSRYYDPLVVKIALRLAEPHRWIQWSNEVFATGENQNDKHHTNSSCATFVNMLYTLLQCSTGLRTAGAGTTGVQSAFMSQLAFDATLLEGLWTSASTLLKLQDDEQPGMKQNRQQEEEYKLRELSIVKTMSVFSDLFAHHLLAVNDEEFLSQYTSVHHHHEQASPAAIVAEDLIGRLRHLLYGLYWIRPVVVTDVGIPDQVVAVVAPSSIDAPQKVDFETQLSRHRARLMLSGTKLWNSLYERWCRLVRSQSLTDESSWWFPHLMTKDDTNAVNADVSGTHIMHDSDSEHDLHNSSSMDIDSESDDNDLNDDGSDSDEDSDDEHGQQERTAAEQESDALAEAFKDPKMARILTCIPQALPFDRRVKLFSSLLHYDRLRTQDEDADFRHMMREMAEGDGGDFANLGVGRIRVQINRQNIYSESFKTLNKLGNHLKKKVQITFVNQHGAVEPGIDGGGVFKEFLDDLIKEAFYPDKEHGSTVPQLFSVTPLQTLAVNTSRPALLTQEQHQMLFQNYEFLGRVLGKAVYESILVEPQFCLPFLNKLLGKQNTLDDLKNFDAEVYKHLLNYRNMNAEEIEAMGLNFEWTFGNKSSTRTVELIPGGSSIPVTKQNVILYVNLVAHQHLNIQGSIETKAFLRGFRDLIPASWVRLFSGYELQKLISGDDAVQGIDVAGLKVTMQYAGGYHPDQPIIQSFWEVLEEITPEQQRKFLRFMTSCSRQPLLGFQSLSPAPCIQQIRLPDHLFDPAQIKNIEKNTNLPTSSTCMNLLKLPNYRNKQLLKRKLLDAIESGAGFELT